MLTKRYNFAPTWHEPKNALVRTATAAVRGSSIYGPAYHPSIGERLRSSGSGGMNYGLERHADADGLLPLYAFLVVGPLPLRGKKQYGEHGWMEMRSLIARFMVQFHGWFS